MPNHDYIPEDDAGFASWADQFATNILSSPSSYALSMGQAESIRGVVNTYLAALERATNEMTRNKGTIADKDDARFAAEHMCRGYAMLAKLNTGIADADKLFIGVRPINASRTKINCPQISPMLNVVGAMPGVHELRYRDTSADERVRAKPYGAKFIEIWVALGEDRIKEVEKARPVGLFTTNPITVNFTQDDDRKKATYHARWVSARGETGPWSLPVSMTIAA